MEHADAGVGEFADPPPRRARHVDVRPFPQRRKIVIGAVRAGRRRAPMHGLISVDLTEARARLAASRPRSSVTGYLVACVGRAAAASPEVHAYRTWSGRLVVHSHVDVATMVEVGSPEGPVPFAHLVRDADVRTVADITSEIRHVQKNPETSRGGRLMTKSVPAISKVPGATRIFYRVLERSVRARQLSGTVSVTSVGMFGGGGGFGVGFPTVLTLGVLVGGISEQPRVVDGEVLVREVLDLTVTADHNIVDGAPLARFVADLRELVERGELIG